MAIAALQVGPQERAAFGEDLEDVPVGFLHGVEPGR